MSTLLVERAENFDFETLRSLQLTNEGLKSRLIDYLFSKEKRPLFLLGPKGAGKTLNAMMALSETVQEKKDFIPTMFIYKQRNILEPLNPVRLAPPDVWGDRYRILQSCQSKEELMQAANAIIYDDWHYRFEDVAQGKEDPFAIVNDLNRILDEVKKGKKTILISEDPMFYYAERLKIKELDDILPKFGQIPKTYDSCSKDEWEIFMKEMDYLASLEVHPFSYEEWKKLFSIYNVDMDEPIINFLYNSNPKPRAFIKFIKLFHPNTMITMGGIQEKALEMLGENVYKRNLEFYRFLIQIPIIETYMRIKTFGEVLRQARGPDNLIKLYEFLPVIEKICKKARNVLKRPIYVKSDLWKDPRYALKEKSKEDPIEVQRMLQNIILEKISERHRNDVNNFVKAYYSKSELNSKNIKSAYEILTTLRKRTEKVSGEMRLNMSRLDGFFNRMSRNISKYYIEIGSRDDPFNIPYYGDVSYWLLSKPFEVAFTSTLYEKPTMEILC